jgi:hypothetical protein
VRYALDYPAFPREAIDRTIKLRNIQNVARAIKLFNAPTILSTVAEKTFGGSMIREIIPVFPVLEPADTHPSMNSIRPGGKTSKDMFSVTRVIRKGAINYTSSVPRRESIHDHDHN